MLALLKADKPQRYISNVFTNLGPLKLEAVRGNKNAFEKPFIRGISVF